MRILHWHVHAAWSTAFVQGPHTYLIPTVPGRTPEGAGRPRTYDWPEAAVEITPEALGDADIDVVVLQRPGDEELARRWLGGRRPGRDVPAVWLEHNAPQGRIGDLRHPVADRDDLTLVHVTHTNDLFWDSGSTPTTVIDHGIVDPGHRYTGELERAAVVVNEPLRRGRVTGTDLLVPLSRALPIDLFGIASVEAAAALRDTGGDVTAGGDLPHAELHEAMARRRVYLHPVRWTSLGLSLLEAMHLGMPVVALSTTDVPEAVPPEAGVVSNRLAVLTDALRRLGADAEEAAQRGKAARAAALERHGLARFLADWDRLLARVVA
ncbi:MAG: glycosyltransferase family 4 protein [Acidimicrobiia bacterium]|nr:glycosyltransferase family 4 protein [Acidimicrobiia bacterium]